MASKTSSCPSSEEIQPSSTTGRVEGVLRKHDVDLIVGVGDGFDGHYPGLDLLALVADKTAPDVLVPERGDDPLVALHGLPGAVPLRLHRGLKSRLIKREAPPGEHLPRDLDRETVGVVQHERDVAREVSPTQPLYLGDQKRHPGLVDLHEPRSLARDHAPNVLPRPEQLLVEIAP